MWQNEQQLGKKIDNKIVCRSLLSLALSFHMVGMKPINVLTVTAVKSFDFQSLLRHQEEEPTGQLSRTRHADLNDAFDKCQ